MNIYMNFNEYIIDKSDYEFFDSLPKDEKIIFLYDLICEDFYGAGSIDIESTSQTNTSLKDFDSFLSTPKPSLYILPSIF